MTFSERMQDLIDKGITASREIAGKAGEQAQAWGEMGVLKIEIIQLRSEAEKHTAKLGALVYARFVEESAAELAVADPGVKALLQQIRRTETAILEKESRYRKLGGKDGDLE